MLNPHMKLRYLVVLELKETPQIDPHAKKSQNAETFSMIDEEPEVNSEWGDQYVNTDLLLPRRG